MKLFKLMLVLLSLTSLFACNGGDGYGDTNTGGGGTPSPPPAEGPDAPIAADVLILGRQGAFDEASALVDTDLINAESRAAR